MALSVTIDPNDSARLIFSQPVTLQQAIAFLWAKPPASKNALRPDPSDLPRAGAQKKFLIDKGDFSLIFSLQHGLADQYAKRIKPIMAKGPATLPSWVPSPFRERVLAFKVPSGVYRLPGQKPWGDVVVWIQRGTYLHVEAYNEYPSDIEYYLGITHGNEHNARLLRNVYTQYNKDMRVFLEEKHLSPEYARAEIRRINEEVFKLVIEGSVGLLSAGAGVSAMNAAMRQTAPKVINAAKNTRFARSIGSLRGISVNVTQNESAAIGRLQTALRNKQPWSSLGTNDRALLGNLFHKVVEPLSEFIFAGVGRVLKRPRITKELVAALKKDGGRVLIVEGEMMVQGKPLRVDLAELDFRNSKLTVIDLTSVERATHVAKTQNYRTALHDLTNFETTAMEMRYIGDDSSSLETLAEALLVAPKTTP
jgi:hypothetical protein